MADDQMQAGIEKSSLTAHERTYDSVISLFKWAMAALVIIVPLVIWLIAA